MTCAGRFIVQILLFTLVLSTHASASTRSLKHQYRSRRQPSPSTDQKADGPTHIDKRGIPGMAGDIEWMGFYGSLLAIPTMLSVLGIVTTYNMQKSYYNSQLNAEYYKQSREMLRAHAAKLIQDQEAKFAKAGITWKGMIYDQDGNVRQGAKVPMWHGVVVGTPPSRDKAQAVAAAAGKGVESGTEGGVAPANAAAPENDAAPATGEASAGGAASTTGDTTAGANAAGTTSVDTSAITPTGHGDPAAAENAGDDGSDSRDDADGGGSDAE